MIQSNQVRIGMVGCGAIAELYHLPALSTNPRTKAQISLADPNGLRLDGMKRKFTATQTVYDYRELLGLVDGVIIATPPRMHYPMAKFFLENGVHVLSEKPLSESIDEARELVAIGKANSAALAVNQTRRFFPTYGKIRDLIAQGILGKLESITYHDGQDFDWPAATPHHFQPNAKGTWSDVGVHLLDSVCFWLNKTPSLVLSQNDSCGGPEAMATVNLESDGCKIEIKVSRLGKMSNGFRIVGSLGSIVAEAEDWDEFTVSFRNGESKRFKVASNRLKYNDFAMPMLDNFVDVIQGKAQPIVSGESVLGTIELLEQAYGQATRYRMPWNDYLQSWNVQTKVRTDDSTGSKRVLVTGVSGFVGGRVVEAMAMSGLFHPVAAVRNWARAARSAVHPVSLVQCDIMNSQDVHAAVKGVDAIVHCAYTDERNGIVGATKNLLEAAKAHGVSDFIYLSSAEVYGNNRQGTVTEDEVLSPMGRDYGDAKLEAEALCHESALHGVYATILRPSLIYGPHGESWSIKIGKKLQSGNWGMFEGFGEGFANLIYVDDLVKAIVLSLQQPSRDCRVYNVNGFEPPTWNQYFQEFNRALGLPELVAISPSKSKWKTAATDVVRSITSRIKTRFYDQLMEIYLRGGMASQMMKRLKGRLDSTPSGGELTDLYARKAIYVDDKIRKELGYRPHVSLEHGLRMTIQWMLHHELIADPKRIPAYRSYDEDPKELVLS